MATETLKVFENLHIEDCYETQQDISINKQTVLKALHRKNEENLCLLGKGKCKRILYEPYEKKEYLSNKTIFNFREHYCTRYRMLPFAGNYSHSKKYAATNYLVDVMKQGKRNPI